MCQLFFDSPPYTRGTNKSEADTCLIFLVSILVLSQMIIWSIFSGIIIVDTNQSRILQGLYPTCAITYATCEKDLFCNIVTLISKCNPDILIGWELETLSWGYVLQRAAYLGVNLAMSISRIPGMKCTWESQAVDLEAFAEIKLSGRIVLDLWRIMRHENGW